LAGDASLRYVAEDELLNRNVMISDGNEEQGLSVRTRHVEKAIVNKGEDLQ